MFVQNGRWSVVYLGFKIFTDVPIVYFCSICASTFLISFIITKLSKRFRFLTHIYIYILIATKGGSPMDRWNIDVAVLCIFFARPEQFEKSFEQVKKARPRVLLLWLVMADQTILRI